LFHCIGSSSDSGGRPASLLSGYPLVQ